MQVLSGHVQWVYCCSISPDCSMLCSAAGEKSVSPAGWEPPLCLLNPALQKPPWEKGQPILPWLFRSWKLESEPPWFKPCDAPSLIPCPNPSGAAVEHEILHAHPQAGGPPEQRGVL